MNTLTTKRCLPCEGGIPSLDLATTQKLLQTVNGWEIRADNKEISRTFAFKDYYRTMAFVNAIAFIAHYEGHHPDLEISYDHCKVRYSTHAIDGLTENDFICAAKIDALFKA